MRRRKPKNISFDEWFGILTKKGDGCWEWLGGKFRTGYGVFRSIPGESAVAHRYAYKMAFGPVSPELNVLHRCDNPSCVRPEHLFLGTQADNLRDMALKGRAGQRRLKWDDGYAVLWRAVSGEVHKKLAAEYGINRQSVGDILHRRKWMSLSHIHD